MSNLRIGTSGWNYPAGQGTWNGLFYPPGGQGTPPEGRQAQIRRARVLRRTFRYRRSQHHLLRAAEGDRRADVGRPHPARFRVLAEAIPRAHPRRYPGRAAARRGSHRHVPPRGRTARRRRQNRGAARAVPSQLQAEPGVAGLSRRPARAVPGLPCRRRTSAPELERRLRDRRCRC